MAMHGYVLLLHGDQQSSEDRCFFDRDLSMDGILERDAESPPIQT
jgi:hypothetical protein